MRNSCSQVETIVFYQNLCAVQYIMFLVTHSSTSFSFVWLPKLTLLYVKRQEFSSSCEEELALHKTKAKLWLSHILIIFASSFITSEGVLHHKINY